MLVKTKYKVGDKLWPLVYNVFTRRWTVGMRFRVHTVTVSWHPESVSTIYSPYFLSVCEEQYEERDCFITMKGVRSELAKRNNREVFPKRDKAKGNK